mgnify:FL=1
MLNRLVAVGVIAHVHHLHLPDFVDDAAVIALVENRRHDEYRIEHPGEPFDAALFDKSAKEYWQLAYDNAKEVYDSHAYSLVPNFADLWVYTNKHTEESILEMEMNYVTGSCPFMYRYLPGYWEGVPLTNSSNNYGQIRPSREAWDEHNDRYPGDWREECTYLCLLYTSPSPRDA